MALILSPTKLLTALHCLDSSSDGKAFSAEKIEISFRSINRLVVQRSSDWESLGEILYWNQSLTRINDEWLSPLPKDRWLSISQDESEYHNFDMRDLAMIHLNRPIPKGHEPVNFFPYHSTSGVPIDLNQIYTSEEKLNNQLLIPQVKGSTGAYFRRRCLVGELTHLIQSPPGESLTAFSYQFENFETSKGDSGSPVFAYSTTGQLYALGLHIGDTDQYGFAIFIGGLLNQLNNIVSTE